jgi:hypothetical protein
MARPHITGGLHEAPELGHGDRMLVDPESVDAHLPDRPLLRVELHGSHPERAALDQHHAVRSQRHRHILPAHERSLCHVWAARAVRLDDAA